MKQITVEFDLKEDMEVALLELLPCWNNYTGKEGDKPFADWTIEKLFETLMQMGSFHTIWRHIKEEQFRQNMITIEELLDEKQLTAAQRIEARQQAQEKKEGACV